jgi:flavin reductase ActVB
MAALESLLAPVAHADGEAAPGMLRLDQALVGQAFREAMSNLAAGVVMVTCRIDGRPWGMTVSACISVSMSPPTLLVSLGTESSAARAIEVERSFGVSILGQGQIDAARYGSASGAPKFLEPFLDHRGEQETRSKTPVVAGALGHVDCRVVEQVGVGDHTLFLGRVRAVLLSPGDEPLIYYGRAYRALAAGPASG